MPKIPQFTAQSSAAVVQFPQGRIPEGSATSVLASGVQNLAGELADITSRLRKNQDELDFTRLTSEYDSRLKVMQSEIFRDPNVEDPLMEFGPRSAEIQNDILAGAKTDTVKRALQAHIAKTIPAAQANVQLESVKLWGQKQLADISATGDRLALTAAEAPTPEARDAAINEYTEILNRAEQRRILSPTQRYDEQRKFTKDMLTKNMEFIARSDRNKLYEMDRQGMFYDVDPTTRLKILEQARLKDEHDEVVGVRNFKKFQDLVEKDYSAMANQGAIPQAELESMLKGENPYITPDKARELHRINSNPILGRNTTSVKAIMLDYHSGSPTMDRVMSARQQLKLYMSTMPGPDPDLDKAFNELQNDERSAEAGGRAERSVRAAEIANNLRIAEDTYNTSVKPIMPGFLGQMQKAASAADMAAIRNQVRKGTDPKKAVEDVMKKRQEQSKKPDAATQGVLDLVPR